MKKIYLVAVIFALLTGIAVYGFAGALEKASKREYTQVVVAIGEIPERTIITAEMLAIKEIPSEVVLPTAIREISVAIGLFTDNKIDPGEVLSSSKLHTQGEKTGTLNYFIPVGKRAFTISVDAVSGVSGFISPGDRIDILANMSLDKKEGDVITQVATSLILSQNIEVLAAGASVKVEQNGVNISYATLTLAVTPQEAVMLNLAAATGILRAVLRSPLDKDIIDVAPKTPKLVGNTLG